MIPFDFEYVKPDSITEAITRYQEFDAIGMEPKYYCGGTEIITMARLNQLQTKAIIDIKGIAECHVFDWQNDQLVIGAAVPLAMIERVQAFPLLGRVCNRIADHTARCKITIGGNISGKIMYREAVLPILVADATCMIATEKGVVRASIHDVFDGQLQIHPPDFLLQVIVDRSMTELPYVSEKKTKVDRIGYPVVSIAAVQHESNIRIAFSGVGTGPFRSMEMEQELNNRSLNEEDRIDAAIAKLPLPVMEDQHASSAFRTFLLRSLLQDTIHTFEGGLP